MPKKILLTNKYAGEQLWQDSYYDRIIRDDNDFLAHWQYIDNNPYRWADDEYNPAVK